MASPEERGLPADPANERLILGAILLDSRRFASLPMEADEFSLESHRRIFKAMIGLEMDGEDIDHVTVTNFLMSRGELESVGGMSYIVSLEDGLPDIPHLDAYVRRVKEKAARRRIIFASQKAINQAMTGDVPLNEIVSGANRELLQLELDKRSKGLRSPRQIFEEAGGVVSFMDKTITMGLSTGYEILDETVYGLQPEDVYVIGGITGSGKSSLAINIAGSLAIRGEPGLYMSLEMAADPLIGRMACAIAQVAHKKYILKTMDATERYRIAEALAKIEEMPLYFDDTVGMTISDMETKIARAVSEKGIKWWVLDYLQKLDFHRAKGMRFASRYEAVTYASMVCKSVCQRFKIPGVIVSSLRRADRKSRGERPTLDMLRESGNVEYDASAVMLVHREEMFNKGREDLRGKAELILAKNRHGARAVIPMEFKGKYFLFLETGGPADEDDA